jgi:hypothetical protein
MSDELGKDRGVFCKKDKILESIIKSIFGSTEVVITGKCGRELELREELSMKIEFLFSKYGLFIYVRTINEDFIGIR